MDHNRTHRQFRNLTVISPLADVAMLEAGDYSTLPIVLGDDALARAAGARKRGPQRVLVLGGTGYVGVHLIHGLLLDPAIAEVVAIARPRGETAPRERIVAAMAEYDLDTESLPLEKLTCVTGVVTAPRFGIEPGEYERLSERIDTVVHAACRGDYGKSYWEMRENWVEGMYEVIDFCLEGTVKHLTYIGSVISRIYRNLEDLRQPDEWWHSGYAQTKWVNQGILTALAGQGLPVTVCEAPYVLGSRTGGRDKGLKYAWWRMVVVFRALGMLWDGPGMNFVPSDLLVDTVIQNAHLPEPLALVRPVLPGSYTMASFAELNGCRIVSREEFHRAAAAIPVEAARRLVIEDMADLIIRTNHDPIFPSESLASGLPSPLELMESYVERLDPELSRAASELAAKLAQPPVGSSQRAKAA